ncbi:MAG TPA: phosphate acyltransferase PlsX [Candidatus Binataceae bacterium]|nr:phosphate acyltransferase PlsX [Candidatus Binataceae bacterium]
MRIALDAMGGDLAPKAAVEGGVLAARDFAISVVLVGDREIVARELAEHQTEGLPIRIEHAPEVVTMDESPLESAITKTGSSIHVGCELVKDGRADGFVSAGNSGAVMTAAMVVLGNLANVDRPAIASLVPTTHGQALLIDAGANTEVKPVNLVQFAVMGSVYWRRVRKALHPRVGILSNGEEASKGTEATRAAAATLAQMSAWVNYVGYVEGHDINRGKVDVVVTDGFTGNIALKTMEGFASFMLANLREALGGNWRGRLAYLLARKRLGQMRDRLDPYEYGGAPLLGVNGVTIIAHGSSNARGIRNAVRAAANEALVRQVNAEISEILAKGKPTVAEKPAGKGIRALFQRMRERLQRHPREPEAAKPVGAEEPSRETIAAAQGELGLRERPGDAGAQRHGRVTGPLDAGAVAPSGNGARPQPEDQGAAEAAPAKDSGDAHESATADKPRPS